MDEVTLKPCPFCGSSRVRVGEHGGYHYVACQNCSCRTAMLREAEDVVGDWNQRADAQGEAVTAQDVAALVKLLKAARAQMARIIGDHNAPSDCYATGPLTGDALTDLVSCPSCEGELMLADIDTALAKHERTPHDD